ncbi:hypothetical protein [Verrucomicrobium spinosum]|uniref:hypothetical protein n=1 Tax=Verrucomicrobium spinosum TaxID=2736 RepID=UPI00017465E6|nr:hypothetical protein [Verrucomicrobium spinosum]
MKTVHYHQAGKPPTEMHVVKTHPGGAKVDLAYEEKGEVVVSGCVLSLTPEIGSATVIVDESDKGKKKTEAKVKLPEGGAPPAPAVPPVGGESGPPVEGDPK